MNESSVGEEDISSHLSFDISSHLSRILGSRESETGNGMTELVFALAV